MSQSKPQPPETPRLPAAGFKAGLFVRLSVTAGLILIAAIAAAYIFLVHIPNKPENVYRRGMESVGAGIQYLITPDFLNEIASTSFSGEMIVDYRGEGLTDTGFRLRFDGQYDTANALLNAGAELSYETEDFFGGIEQFRGHAGMNAIFVNAADDEAPKLYFRFNDLDLPPEYEEQLDAALEFILGETLENLLGGWLLLDFQTLIDTGLMTDEDLSEIDLEQEISQEESQEVVLLLAENLSEYIFTAETEKMVFQMDEFLGKEDFEGRSANRYSVTFNQANAEAFLTSVRDDLTGSAAWQKVADDSLSSSLLEQFSDAAISDAAADFDDSTSAEVWIDSKTKVLRNIRFSDINAAGRGYGNYFEIGVDLSEKSKAAVKLKTVSYDIYACEEYWSFDGSVGMPGSVSEDCPYVFGEPRDDCGERPLYGDFLPEDYYGAYGYGEHRAAVDEYDACIRPPVLEVKADAVPEIFSLQLSLDVKESGLDYLISYTGEGMLIRFTMTTTGRPEAVDVRPPEDYKLLFDSDDLKAIEVNTADIVRSADVANLQAQVYAFFANNNGRLPDGDQFVDSVLPQWHPQHYRDDAVLPDGSSDSPAGGVSYQTSFPGDLSDRFLPNPDQIHVFAETKCGAGEMSDDANEQGIAGTNKYAAGDLVEANARSLAFVYALAGEYKPLCVDNH